MSEQQSVIYISIGDKIFRCLCEMVVSLDIVMLECSSFLERRCSSEDDVCIV